MTLNIYLEGTNAGNGIGASITSGVNVAVVVASGRVAGKVAVLADGPKGVGVWEESGLGVTVGPMTEEESKVTGLVQAYRRNRVMEMNNER
jgi:hypothetical protein